MRSIRVLLELTVRRVKDDSVVELTIVLHLQIEPTLEAHVSVVELLTILTQREERCLR